jgi:hypothetical protein
MCTLAWGPSGDGFWACFNRDEQRDRATAETPAIREAGDHQLIYARDPEGGGTWFAASTAGFAVALLNRYPGEEHPISESKRSRGRLVVQLALSGSADAAARLMGECDLSDYAPFYLFILGGETPRAHAWDGERLTFPHLEDAFWTTSSYKPEEVSRWRCQWWDATAPGKAIDRVSTAGLLRTVQPEQPAYGTTMDRDRARTQSQIELEMANGRCTFIYRAREAGNTGFESPVVLHSTLTSAS